MAVVAGTRVAFLTGTGLLSSLVVTVVLGALVYSATFLSLLTRPFGELVEIVMPSKDTTQRGA